MLSSKCPGQDMRYWSYDDIHTTACPNCGEGMEFWKTDVRLRCKKCGKRVVNEKFDLGCAEWCAYAKHCIGDIVKDNSAYSFKKKLTETAYRLLQKDEREKLAGMIKQYEEEASKEGKEIVEKIAAAVFEAIREKHGEEKVTEIFDTMMKNGEIPPVMVGKIRRLKDSG